ncbi:YceK/YidQ family lipoprotein [Pseudomonas aeruginosa]|nr:hypothetical protein CDG78_02520 [Pseudomonas paraeruginosa]RQF91051.1 YceK/YidQ family lipoprotein [Pseudomonas aeruginosa]
MPSSGRELVPYARRSCCLPCACPALPSAAAVPDDPGRRQIQPWDPMITTRVPRPTEAAVRRPGNRLSPTALICKISIVCLSVNMVSLPSDAAVDTLLLPYHALRQHG